MKNSTFIYFVVWSYIYTYLLEFQKELHNFQTPYWLRELEIQAGTPHPHPHPALPCQVARETVWRHRPPVATLGNCLARPGFTLPLVSLETVPNRALNLAWPSLPWSLPPFQPLTGWAWACLWKFPWISNRFSLSWHVSSRLGAINLGQSFQTGS